MSNAQNTCTTEELLDQLRELGNECSDYGWYDGEGDPVTSRALHMAAEVLNTNKVKPFIYASVDGGIQFEWDTELDDCTILNNLTFMPNGDTYYFYCSSPEDGPQGGSELISPSIEEVLQSIIYL